MEKAKILALLLSFLLTSCYEKYTMDYEHTAAYVAYQYDLRTFVIGEGMKFNFTVALGGVVKNTHDRSVQVVIDYRMGLSRVGRRRPLSLPSTAYSGEPHSVISVRAM